MIIPALIALIISLGILGIVYILFKWIIGMIALPAPILQVANIVFGIIAVVIVLQFLLKLL